MNSTTADAAKKAISFFQGEVDPQRLTGGSLPGGSGLVVAIRSAGSGTVPANGAHAATNGNGSANGDSGGLNGGLQGAPRFALEALLVVADEGADEGSIMRAVAAGSKIGPAGDLVGDETRSRILSWQAAEKDPGGAMTDRYILSVAAALIEHPLSQLLGAWPADANETEAPDVPPSSSPSPNDPVQDPPDADEPEQHSPAHEQSPQQPQTVRPDAARAEALQEPEIQTEPEVQTEQGEQPGTETGTESQPEPQTQEHQPPSDPPAQPQPHEYPSQQNGHGDAVYSGPIEAWDTQEPYDDGWIETLDEDRIRQDVSDDGAADLNQRPYDNELEEDPEQSTASSVPHEAYAPSEPQRDTPQPERAASDESLQVKPEESADYFDSVVADQEAADPREEDPQPADPQVADPQVTDQEAANPQVAQSAAGPEVAPETRAGAEDDTASLPDSETAVGDGHPEGSDELRGERRTEPRTGPRTELRTEQAHSSEPLAGAVEDDEGSDEEDDNPAWVAELAAGKTHTPEQRSYFIAKEKAKKRSLRLLLRQRAPEPPGSLANIQNLQDEAIKVLATAPEGPGIVTPLINKGGTGKTSVAVELAFTFARMMGSHGDSRRTGRVLIVDQNLTNPDLAHRVNVEGAGRKGVKDLLEGDALHRVVGRTALPNLDTLFLLGNGDRDLQSVQDALSDQRTMEALISTLATGTGQYDIIVVDTANTLPAQPNNPASYAMTMWAAIADVRYLVLQPEKASFKNAAWFASAMGEALKEGQSLIPVMNSFPQKRVYEEAPITAELAHKRKAAIGAIEHLQQSPDYPIEHAISARGRPLDTPLTVPDYPEEVRGFAAEGRPISMFSQTFADAYKRIAMDAIRRMLMARMNLS